MQKLKITIHLDWYPDDDYIALMKCIESRRFPAARLVFNDVFEDFLPNQNRALSLVQALKGIRDLTIAVTKISSSEHFLQTLSHLLPQAKNCKIKCICLATDELTPAQSEFWHDRFQLAPCNLLTDLHVENCDIGFLSRVLVESINLKCLSIDSYNFTPENLVVKGASVWQIVRFKLQKIELLRGEIALGETFKEFLAGQTDLREMSLEGLDSDFKSLLQLIPNIMKIYVYDSMDMGSFPLNQFHKFGLLAKEMGISRITELPEYTTSNCKFPFFAHDDVCAIESKFLAFLDRDTNIPGLKNGQVITQLEIGSQNWIDEGATFSEDFILNIISRMPNLEELKIYSAQTIEEIKGTINRSSETHITKLDISGTDGMRVFNADVVSCRLWDDEYYDYRDYQAESYFDSDDSF